MKKYVAQNVDWTINASEKYKTEAPYWHQVNLLIKQFDGLYHGKMDEKEQKGQKN